MDAGSKENVLIKTFISLKTSSSRVSNSSQCKSFSVALEQGPLDFTPNPLLYLYLIECQHAAGLISMGPF